MGENILKAVSDLPNEQNIPDLDIHWNSFDPAASEATFLAMLPAARSSGGPSSNDKSHYIELLIQTARAQTAQNKAADALKNLDEAETLLKEHQAVYRVSVKIRWLLERGRLYICDKTPSQALRLFSEAWTLAVNSGEDHFAIDVAQMMAIIGAQKSQQEWILKAISIAEASPQPKAKRCLGNLYASLGWKLFDLHQFEKSLETFQKSLSHLKTYGTAREIFVAKWSAGKILRTMNRTEDALAIQKALLAELGIGGPADGRLYEELAECLQTLQRTSEAQLYFELAYRELSNDEWITDNQPVKLKRMKDLGKVKERR